MLSLFSQNLQAQTAIKLIKKGNLEQSKVYKDYLYFIVGSNNSNQQYLYRIHLPYGQPEPLDTNISFGQSIIMTDSGVFYVTFKFDPNGNDGRHHLNYFSFSKNQKTLYTEINSYVEHPYRALPALAQYINNKYYVSTYYNQKECLWESDGTPAATKIVYSNIFPIQSYTIFGGKPLVFSYQNNTERVIFDNNNNVIFKTPETISNNFFFHTDNHACILSVRNNQLWIITKSLTIDSVSLKNIGARPFYVAHSNDSVVTGYRFEQNLHYTYNLKTKFPYTYDSVPPSKKTQSLGYGKLDKSKLEYMSYWTLESGLELVHVPRFDSLRFIQDLNPGTLYGLGDQLFVNNHIAYFFGNNGSDKKSYLYTCDGYSMKSHFPINKNYSQYPKIVSNFDSFIIWSYRSDDTLFIELRNLNQNTPQPPPTKKINREKNGEWLRTTAPVSKTNPFIGIDKDVFSNAVKSDKYGNVFVSASFPALSGYGNNYLLHTDTNILQHIKGDKLIVKYDSLGQFLWSFSFGNYYNILTNQRKFGFDIDNNGDVVIASKYRNTLNLDTDTFTTPETMWYVMKLDGKTGKLKWIKEYLPQLSASWSHITNLALDDKNNIYVSFMFSQWVAYIDNFELNSVNSPANAVLKLDPNGNYLWAKCTETPWTDRYGTSAAMKYDSVNQCMYDLISQGDYSWFGPCKGGNFKSLVHKINKSGEFTVFQQIEGNDLNGARDLEVTQSQSLFVSGFYRSDLSTHQLNISSIYDKSIGCGKWEQFNAHYNTKNGKALGLRGTPNAEFLPLDMCSDNKYVYVVGQIKDNRSYRCIYKYTHLGRLVGKRILDSCYMCNPFDLYDDCNIAIAGNSHLLISMSSNSLIYPFTNVVPNYEGISVYRLLKNEGWTSVSDNQDEAPISGITIAPNPADNFVRLQFENPENYSKLKIYNSIGQLMQSTVLSGEIYQSISLENLSTGIYTLLFEGQKNHSTKLVVR